VAGISWQWRCHTNSGDASTFGEGTIDHAKFIPALAFARECAPEDISASAGAFNL